MTVRRIGSSGSWRPAAAVCAGLVAAVMVAPTSAASCAGVRSRGAWTVRDVPAAAPETGHGTLTSTMPPDAVTGGRSSREAVVSSRGMLRRTTDGGCTWSTSYSLDVADVEPSGGDTLRTTAQAQGYKVTSLAIEGSHGYALLSKGDANVNAFLVARSLDAGATWTTDVLGAPLPNAVIPTPVLGRSYPAGEMVVASPADPRVAYLVVDSRDPREVSAADQDAINAVPTYPAIYATRDGGATWAFWLAIPPGVPGISQRLVTIRPDTLDPNIAYIVSRTTAEIVTGGAVPIRTALAPLPVGVSYRGRSLTMGLDVMRRKGQPAMLLVTADAGAYDGDRPTDLFLSRDGGRTWRTIPVPPISSTVSLGAYFAGGNAWLTAEGDIVGAMNVPTSVVGMLIQRWSVRTQSWTRSIPAQAAPVPAGTSTVYLSSFAPADHNHNAFLFGAEARTPATGSVTSSPSTDIVGSYNTQFR
jgi:hypothetical protein